MCPSSWMGKDFLSRTIFKIALNIVEVTLQITREDAFMPTKRQYSVFIILLVLLLLSLSVFTSSAQGTIDIKVNFQPQFTAAGGTTVLNPPASYLVDFGQPYGLRIGANQGTGLSYGWVTPGTSTPLDLATLGTWPGNGRLRGTVAVPIPADLRLATFMHMQGDDITPPFNGNPVEGAWEISLPNGTYTVTVSAGDGGGAVDSTHRILADGGVVLINSFVPPTAGAFTTGTGSVTIADGRLTLSATGGTNTKINYVTILSGPAGTQPVIQGITPANGATNVPPSTSISTTGILRPNNAGIDAATVDENSVYLHLFGQPNNRVPALAINTTGVGDAITFTPEVQLQASTQYTFVITADVKDTTGAAVIPFSSSFTTGTVSGGGPSNISFTKVNLGSSAAGNGYSSLAIGPDGGLYAVTVIGAIYRWDISSDGALTNRRTLNVNPTLGGRVIIGVAFEPGSTAAAPIMWVSHNDGGFSNAANFTGSVSRLVSSNFGAGNESWAKTDEVIQLPRSVRDHLSNSLAFGPDGALYLTQGSLSAMGAPDGGWGNRPETLLSAAVLRMNIQTLIASPNPLNVNTGAALADVNNAANNAVGFRPYNAADTNYNPLQPGAALTVFASGIRNAYDLLWHSNGQLYVPTNGSAGGGNVPATPTNIGSYTACQNRIDDGSNGDYTSPVIPAVNSPITQEDYLFRVSQSGGGYYGHPNPTRCEWVINGGNPTAGDDAGQTGNHYPVGTQPDRNWRGAAYRFTFNKSPNGVIEYRNALAFGGALQGRILVVRYSQNDDVIVLQPGGASNNIISEQTGITGLTGFNNPLDLIEQVSTGNIYLLEYGGESSIDDNTITLLRPDQIAAPSPNIVVAPSRIISSDPITVGASAPQVITITNNGQTTLNLGTLTLGGTNANQFQIVNQAANLALAPNTSTTANIAFNPSSPIGVKTATLNIPSNDPDTAVATVELRGLGFTSTAGGNNEPSLQWILDTFNYQVTVGDNDAATTPISGNGSTYPGNILGQEVAAQSFRRAASGNVTIEVLASFGVNANPVTRVGWYLSGNADSKTELFTVVNNSTQRLNPTTSGNLSFDPGNAAFGFYSFWPPANFNWNVYSEDALNTFDANVANRHKVRVYPLRDSAGALVPNAYIVATEEFTSGFDYNDVVYIVRNVQISTGGTLTLENRDWTTLNNLTTAGANPVPAPIAELAYLNSWLTMSELNGGTSGHVFHNTATLRLKNTSLAETLQITGLSIANIPTTNTRTMFTIPVTPSVANPITIAPNGFYDLVVMFNDSTGGTGVRSAALTVTSSDPASPTQVAQLRGGWQSVPEGGQELDIENHIVPVFGFQINLGHPFGSFYTPAGAEVMSFYWRRADSTRQVYVRQLAAFHGCCGAEDGINITGNGGGSFSHEGVWGQSLLPLRNNTTAPAEMTINPTSTNFTFNIAGYNSNGCESFDPDSACFQHGVRFWPVRNNLGVLVPNTYFVIQDFVQNGCGSGSANCDYNDNVYLVTNIEPANATTNLALNIDDAADPVNIDSNITYTITVENLTIFEAEGTVATITLPTGLSFVSATSTLGTCTNTAQTVTCNLGRVYGVTAPVITLVADPASISSYTVNASVTTTTTEPVTANNVGSETTQVIDPNNVPGTVTVILNTNPQDSTPFNFAGDFGAFTLLDDGSTGSANFEEHINFQPSGATVPTGYNVDSGLAYGSRSGGKTYGWITQASVGNATPTAISATGNARDRNRVPAVDQRLDTLMHMQCADANCAGGIANPIAWEYAIPNGIYTVTVSVGDEAGATGYDSQHILHIEGTAVTGINPFQATAALEYTTGTITVSVTDGRLTIDAIGGFNTKINYVDIVSVASTAPDRRVFTNVGTGDYDVTRTLPVGWSSTGMTCTGGSVTPISGGINVVVSSAANVICTFSASNLPGSITVVKDAVPEGSQSFTFNTTGGLTPNEFTLVDGTTFTTPVNPVSIKVNFQNAAGAVPAGYVRDFGEGYAARTGVNQGSGLTYGWVTPSTSTSLNLSLGGTSGPGNGRTRNTIQVDQRLETLMHMQADDVSGIFAGTPTEGAWEIAVPNGQYSIVVSVGDPTIDSNTLDTPRHTINVEGVNFINNFASVGTQGANTRHANATQTIVVTDGKLTIDAIGGFNTKINYVDILQISSLVSAGVNTQVFNNVPLGTYTITEASVASWSLTNVVCTGGNTSPVAGGVSINLASSQNVTCTFSNRSSENGTLSVQNPGPQTDVEGANIDVLPILASDSSTNSEVLAYTASNLPTGLDISPSTGEITGQVDYGAEGVYNVAVTVTRTSPTPVISVNTAFTWTITDTNRQPVVTNPGNRPSDEGAAISLQVAATDPDNDALVYSATGLPTGLTISSSGLISGQISYTAVDDSPYSVVVTVTDDGTPALNDTAAFTWVVNPVNGAPVVQQPDDQSNNEGQAVSLQIVATDPEDDTLIYSADGLPAGFSINTNTGLISGDADNGTSANSPFSVDVTATDGTTPVMVSFQWNIIQPRTVLYRVNTGGPAIDVPNGVDWSADQANSNNGGQAAGTATSGTPSPYVNATGGQDRTFGAANGATFTMADSVPAGTPIELFQNERWDPSGGSEMEWNFPVPANQSVEVRLYLAEIAFNNAGLRVFDVNLEGSPIFDNVDIWEQAGGQYIGIMYSQIVAVGADGNLDLDFVHVVENPSVTAIEIIGLGSIPNQAPVVTNPGTQSAFTNEPFSLQIVASDPNNNPLTYELGLLAAGANLSISSTGLITGTPTNAYGYSISVTVSDGEDDTTINFLLNVTVPTPQPDYWVRVNAGGPEIAATDSGPNWLADSGSTSPYRNSGSNAYSGGGVTSRDASVPAYAPNALYAGERWDPVDDPEMIWTFPVGTPGTYRVNLFMANTCPCTSGVGQRVFNVLIEGQPVLVNLDLSQKYGHQVAGMESFIVTSDANLEILFDHVTENTLVNAIEVISLDTENYLSLSPTNLVFDATQTGQTDTATFTLQNLGGTTPITVNAISLNGVFSASANQNVLDGGESMTVTVAFAPTAVGPASGQLQIVHSGTNSPLTVLLSGEGYAPGAAPVNFVRSNLGGEATSSPTSLDFGPDNRLYVAQRDGLILAYTITRGGATDYDIVATEQINLVRNIPNHNDDGTTSNENSRQVTGMIVRGTAVNPVIYVTSSDPRSSVNNDIGLDTNSGIISRLTWNGTAWTKLDLVRGLPRSEELHAINGIALDEGTNMLYVMIGGHTNMGAPGSSLSYTPEYALSAAMLSVDLDVIGSTTYDLPTLDDGTRGTPGQPDPGDPFGGNDGRNQAMIVPGGPVQVYSPGYRNAYDIAMTQPASGNNPPRMYTFDNGPNGSFGGFLLAEGNGVGCTNQPNNGGSASYSDNLHFVSGPSYYGGHPNPLRANPDGAGLYGEGEGAALIKDFTSTDTPVPFNMANPVECDFRAPGNGNPTGAHGPADGSIATVNASTNGLAVYTATNFGGAMQGNLLAASFDGSIYRYILNQAGDDVINGNGNGEALFAGFGATPLDVTAQADSELFPGTVWAAVYGDSSIVVFEPVDFSGTCTPTDPNGDSDSDGYTNGDEAANGTNACSAGSTPPDFDEDNISDLLDPDDDNDGILDLVDAFAIDAQNGTTTNLPVVRNFDTTGNGLLGMGFTGLMTNGTQHYLQQFNPNNLAAGTAAEVFSVEAISAGDAYTNANTQENGFQFGVNASANTAPFIVQTRLITPFFDGATPINYQSMGLQIGTGDQQNYIKIVVNANGGTGGIEVLRELNDLVSVSDAVIYSPANLLDAETIDLYLEVDPAALTVQPRVAINGGTPVDLGSPISIPAAWLNSADAKGLAVGIISTSTQSNTPFSATWDFITVTPVDGGNTAPIIVNVPDQTNEAGETITALQVSASDADNDTLTYDISGQPTGLNIGQNGLISGTIATTAAAGSPYTVVVTVDDGVNAPVTETFTWVVNPVVEPVTVLYRVNAGGPAIVVAGAGLDWQEDRTSINGNNAGTATVGISSTFVNAAAMTNRTFGTNATIDVTHPSLPAGIPAALFLDERWDPPTSPEMEWNFPIPATTQVEVRLYFAEIGAPNGIGGGQQRLFDVAVEGSIPAALNDINIFATAGAMNKGFVISVPATVSGDGNLDIDFAHIPNSENTAIAAIEIVEIAPAGNVAPVLPVLANQNSEEGDVIALTLPIATDANNDPIIYAATGLPAGLSFNINTRAITGTIDAGTAAGSPYTVSYTANDGTNPTVTGTFTWTVTEPVEPLVVLARVNAGGPQVAAIDGGPNWSADTAGSPSAFVNAIATTNQTYSVGDAITLTASVPAYAPAALFQDERWDPLTPPEMEWNFPVTAGTEIEVRLYFAEIYPGGALARRFNVALEGATVLSNYNVYSEAGNANFTGVMESFLVTVGIDGNVDLDFLHIAGGDNPAIKAIEIIEITPAPINNAPVLAAIEDQSSNEGQTITPIIPSATDDDNDTLSYSATNLPVGISINPTTGQISGTLISGAAFNTPYTVTVTVSDGITSDSESFTWTVGAVQTTGTVLYRVNAGGPTIGDWVADTTGNYFNVGNTYSTGAAITLNPSVPAGTPAQLFQTERWDAPEAPEMQWDFPIPAGTEIELRLYFAEIAMATGVDSGGNPRLFDVAVEGSVPAAYDNLNIFSAGGFNVGVMKWVRLTVTDGNLDIDFAHISENPAIKAFEIISITPAPVNNAPILVDIDDQDVDENGTLTVNLSASDADTGDTLTLNVTGLPTFAAFTDNGDGTGSIAFTPGYNDADVSNITVTVSDGTDSDSDSFVLTVTNINRSPVLASINNVLLAETDPETTVNVSATDADLDTITLIAAIEPNAPLPNFIDFTDNGDGTGFFSIDPGFGDSDNYDLIVTASDGNGGEDQEPFTVSVGDVDQPPQVDIISDTSVVENNTLVVPVSAADPDLPAQVITLTSDEALSFVTFTDSGSGVGFFTINPNFTHAAVYTLNVTASSGNPVLTDTKSFTLTVTNFNRAPVANSQAVNVVEDTATLITLSGTDADGDALTYAVVDAPEHGNLSGTAPNLTYTPDANYVGSDSFTFMVNDGTVNSTSATVSLIVTDNNQAPVANSQAVNVVEDTATLITLSGTDADDDALTYAVVDAPEHGDLSGTAPNLTYTPDANYVGADSFTFMVNDGTVNSTSATVSLTVTDDNQAPTLAVIANQTNAEGNTVNLATSAADLDGDTLTYSITGAPSGISINASGVISGTLDYTTAGSYPTVNVTVNDGNGGTDTSSFAWTVTNTNVAPIISTTVAAQTNAEGASVSIQINASDFDGHTLTYSLTGAPAGISINNTGLISGTLGFTTASSYPTVTVTVNDGNGGTASITFAWTVTNTNRIPTAEAGNNQTVTAASNGFANVTLAGSGTDADSDTLTFAWTEGVTPLATGATPTISLNVGTHVLTLTVSDGNLSATDTVTIIVNAATATNGVTSFTLINANTEQPIPAFNPIPNGATINLALLGTTQISIRINTNPATVGSVRMALNGNANYRTENGAPYAIASNTNNPITYAPWAYSLNTLNTLTATAYNGGSATGGVFGAAQTISFTIVNNTTPPANRPPTAEAGNNQTVTAAANGFANVTLAGSGTDPDGNSLTFAWSEGVTPIATGATPTVSLNVGTHVLTLTVSDGTLTATDTVTIVVNPFVPQPQTIYRINTGGPAVTTGGVAWSADQFFTGGRSNVYTNAIAGTTDDVLYQTERSSTANTLGFSYALPVAQSGSYTVRLHMAELWWTAASGYRQAGLGKRVFNVQLEGANVLTNYDIRTDVQPLTAVIKTFTVTVTDGVLNISFPPGSVDRPTIDAIEVILNNPPLADALYQQQDANIGGDAAIAALPTIVLDASASVDSDGSIVDYTWREGELVVASGATPVVSISLEVGTHILTLTVTDNEGATSTFTLTVIVTAPPEVIPVAPLPIITPINQAPVANAGFDQNLADTDGLDTETVTLGGSVSSDADGGIAVYTWSENGIVIAATSSPTFTVVLPSGIHTLTLSVTDSSGAVSVEDGVTITIASPAPAPIIVPPPAPEVPQIPTPEGSVLPPEPAPESTATP